MAAPITFPSTTINFSLPLLFAGQAQKEFSINQALSLIDAVLQMGVVASLETPPTDPTEGETYRVLTAATGDWAGLDDSIAVFLGGAWQAIAPKDGMTLFDRNASEILHYNSTWKSAVEPAPPSGGATVDTEARTAILDLIQALRDVGIFAA